MSACWLRLIKALVLVRLADDQVLVLCRGSMCGWRGEHLGKRIRENQVTPERFKSSGKRNSHLRQWLKEIEFKESGAIPREGIHKGGLRDRFRGLAQDELLLPVAPWMECHGTLRGGGRVHWSFVLSVFSSCRWKS